MVLHGFFIIHVGTQLEFSINAGGEADYSNPGLIRGNVKCIEKGVDELFEEKVIFASSCTVFYTARIVDDQGNVKNSVTN